MKPLLDENWELNKELTMEEMTPLQKRGYVAAKFLDEISSARKGEVAVNPFNGEKVAAGNGKSQCPECGQRYGMGIDARVDAGMKCGICAGYGK